MTVRAKPPDEVFPQGAEVCDRDRLLAWMTVMNNSTDNRLGRLRWYSKLAGCTAFLGEGRWEYSTTYGKRWVARLRITRTQTKGLTDTIELITDPPVERVQTPKDLPAAVYDYWIAVLKRQARGVKDYIYYLREEKKNITLALPYGRRRDVLVASSIGIRRVVHGDTKDIINLLCFAAMSSEVGGSCIQKTPPYTHRHTH